MNKNINAFSARDYKTDFSEYFYDGNAARPALPMIVLELSGVYEQFKKQVALEFELSLLEVEVLLLIRNRRFFKNAVEMSRFVNAEATSVKRVLFRLQERKMIEELPKKFGKRSVALKLKGEGEQVARLAEIERNNFIGVTLAGFSKSEKLGLERMLRKIKGNIDVFHGAAQEA